VKRYFVLAALLASVSAVAQPEQPMPTTSVPVAVSLSQAPHRDISNVLMTARLGTAK
jgi:hypothetical protein